MNHQFKSADDLGRFCAFVSLINAANTRNIDTLKTRIHELSTAGIEASTSAMGCVQAYGSGLESSDLPAVDAAFRDQLARIARNVEHQLTVEGRPGRAAVDAVHHKAVLLITTAWNCGSSFEF